MSREGLTAPKFAVAVPPSSSDAPAVSIASLLPSLAAGVSQLRAQCDRPASRLQASITITQAQHAEALASLTTLERTSQHEAHAIASSRTKALSAAEEALQISSDQLEAYALMCEAAAEVGDFEEIGPFRSCVLALALLASSATPEDVVHSTLLYVSIATDGTIASIAADASRLRTSASASASGPGLEMHVPADTDIALVCNTFQLCVTDDAGEVVDGVTSDDVVVSVTGAEITGVTPTQPGELTVTYAPLSGAAVSIAVRAFGAEVPGSPWAPVASAGARGRQARTIALPDATANVSLDITPDGQHLLVSNLADEEMKGTVSVYALPSGERVASFGGFTNAMGLCATQRNTILVAEDISQRVQEVALDGTHIRFVGRGVIDDLVSRVATNGAVIAVGKSYRCRSRIHGRVLLFDDVTGNHIRSFGDYGILEGQLSGCSSLTFSPTGNSIVCVDKADISVFSVEGQFERKLGVWTRAPAGSQEGYGSTPSDVSFGPDGTIFVTAWKSNEVCVLTPDGRSLVRKWVSEPEEPETEGPNPRALVSRGPFLYVLCQNAGAIGVFV